MLGGILTQRVGSGCTGITEACLHSALLLPVNARGAMTQQTLHVRKIEEKVRESKKSFS